MRYVSSFVCLAFVFIMLSASTSSCERPITDGSYSLNSSTSQSGTDYRAMARQDAIDNGIDPTLFERQINQESGFNPNAVSSAGAIGIAQIVPSTAASWNIDPWNAADSLRVAADHMHWYYQHYGYDYAKALAAYNCGPNCVSGALAGCSPFWRQCIPNETQRYIDNIMS